MVTTDIVVGVSSARSAVDETLDVRRVIRLVTSRDVSISRFDNDNPAVAVTAVTGARCDGPDVIAVRSCRWWVNSRGVVVTVSWTVVSARGAVVVGIVVFSMVGGASVVVCAFPDVTRGVELGIEV